MSQSPKQTPSTSRFMDNHNPLTPCSFDSNNIRQSSEYREWLSKMIKDYYRSNPKSLLKGSLTEEGNSKN